MSGGGDRERDHPLEGSLSIYLSPQQQESPQLLREAAKKNRSRRKERRVVEPLSNLSKVAFRLPPSRSLPLLPELEASLLALARSSKRPSWIESASAALRSNQPALLFAHVTREENGKRAKMTWHASLLPLSSSPLSRSLSAKRIKKTSLEAHQLLLFLSLPSFLSNQPNSHLARQGPWPGTCEQASKRALSSIQHQ